ncbi:MAG TPA: PA14 domain-containing protein [Chryseosolibacter sp.]|nr:PA14 domain-containing protein [Chryseosolibacter sp.]
MKHHLPVVTFHHVYRIGFYLLFILLMLVLIGAVKAQPVLIKQLSSGSHLFTTVNGSLYYAASDSLFKSDGTSAGTTFVVKVGQPITGISKVTDGRVLFLASSEDEQTLWVTDGTAGGTVQVGTHPSITPILTFNNTIYLRINDGIHGSELWKLSGGSLTMVKDLNLGSGTGLGAMVVSNGILYFAGSTTGVDYDLWKSDGTEEGTMLAVDMPFTEGFGSLTDVDGTIFFVNDSLYDWDYTVYTYLWKTNGTAESTVLVKAFEPDYYNNLYHFNVMNGKLYFIRDYSVPDHFLMVSDGTEAGTQVVKRVERDGQVMEMLRLKDNLVLYSQSQSIPGALQRSDGTTEGTQPFWALNEHYWFSNESDPIDLTLTRDYAFFVDQNVPSHEYPQADDENQIFQSDLSTEGTQSLKNMFDVSFRGSNNIQHAVDNKIFFTTQTPGDGLRLWFYDATPAVACAGTGGVLRQVWNNIEGPAVTDIPVDTPPDSQETVTTFTGPSNAGDRYGSRYRGYLCVPETGEYEFLIASNDHSELWLSTDASNENRTRIAYVNGYTNRGQYNKYPTQRSVKIMLQRGQRYYIEALHKEGVGTDHISVAMRYPDGTMEAPIQGSRLIPYSDNIAPMVSITSPENGAVFPEPGNITIEASASDSDGEVVRVDFYIQRPFTNRYKMGEDATAPYSFTLNDLPSGEYTFEARAVDNEGLVASSEDVTVNVSGCIAAGNILREVWTNVEGSRVSDIPIDREPDQIQSLDILEGPVNAGIHYGARIRGYICPPVSGHYTFYIASNDHSELWISQDGTPENKQMVARILGATNPRQWDKYAGQQSVQLVLFENRPVYIEVLHKQGVGGDHVAVGWRMPDGTYERPINGSRLSPFEAEATMSVTPSEPVVMERASADMISLWPNPVESGVVSLTVQSEASDGIHEGQVTVINSFGEVITEMPIRCNGNCDNALLDLQAKALQPGVYIVKGTIDNASFTKRLIVR